MKPRTAYLGAWTAVGFASVLRAAWESNPASPLGRWLFGASGALLLAITV